MHWRRTLDRPAARFARMAGLVVVGLALGATAVFVFLPFLAREFVRGVELLVTGCLWIVTSIGVGVSIWTVLATIGRAIGGAVATPMASVLFAVLVLVGVAALYWLQRLLESEEESSQ